MSKYKIEQLTLGEMKLDLSRCKRIDELVRKWKDIPPQYEHFLRTCGGAEIVDMIVFNDPDDILDGLDETRRGWDDFFHWNDDHSKLTEEDMQKCYPVGDFCDEYEIVYKSGRKKGFYALPRDEDYAILLGHDLEEMINFILCSGKVCDVNDYYEGNPPEQLFFSDPQPEKKPAPPPKEESKDTKPKKKAKSTAKSTVKLPIDYSVCRTMIESLFVDMRNLHEEYRERLEKLAAMSKSADKAARRHPNNQAIVESYNKISDEELLLWREYKKRKCDILMTYGMPLDPHWYVSSSNGASFYEYAITREVRVNSKKVKIFAGRIFTPEDLKIYYLLDKSYLIPTPKGDVYEGSSFTLEYKEDKWVLTKFRNYDPITKKESPQLQV